MKHEVVVYNLKDTKVVAAAMDEMSKKGWDLFSVSAGSNWALAVYRK